ncbi:MAG: CBS domain-containing protein [Candidatus Dormibacteria bacterium]
MAEAPNLTVAEVMRGKIPACTLRTPVVELSRRMADEEVRSLIVASSGSDLVAGTVSDLDLLRALVEGRMDGMAADVMSLETPATVHSSDSLAVAVERLKVPGTEVLVVLGGDPERPVGVLTAGDVAAHLARH